MPEYTDKYGRRRTAGGEAAPEWRLVDRVTAVLWWVGIALVVACVGGLAGLGVARWVVAW